MLDLPVDQVQPNSLEAEAAITAGHALATQISATDWLGPLAPIALSPFFGLMILSGAATFGPEWLQNQSALFGESSFLNNPLLFWLMAALALFTSLPRLTKLSKPLALAAENLETYSALIILGVVRFLSYSSSEPLPEVESTALAAAGLGSLPLDVLMMLFAAINVIVINLVKLTFEFLVMVVPFPTIDALLEAGNKTACAALMALYMFSPFLATLVNLVLLAICCLVFGWCYRKLSYYREILAGPLLAWLAPQWFAQRGDSFRAFTAERFEGLPAGTAVSISQASPQRFKVVGRWLWKSASVELKVSEAKTEPYMVIAQKLQFTTPDQTFTFHHRKWVEQDEKATFVTPAAELA